MKFDKFISLTVTHIKITDSHIVSEPEIETNNKSWNNNTFITAELSPIHIGRLIPPGTPVGIERGLMGAWNKLSILGNFNKE